jgi:uncharacterized membrane protein
VNATTHPQVSRYLKELERALRDIPRTRRDEIVEEISEHIKEASVGVSAESNESSIRALLDQVGEPEEIAQEARERLGITRRSAGALESFAIALLLVGGLILPGVGWIVGVVLLWMSRVWTTLDKLVGTLVLPGGLAFPAFLFLFGVGFETCTTVGGSERIQVSTCSTEPLMSRPIGLIVAIVVTLLPIATALYLGRRAWRS